MKAFCITGPLQQDLDHIANLFSQMNMSQALPAKNDPSCTITWWHKQLADLEEETTTSEEAEELNDSTPGRLWEQLASEIFLANVNVPVWGWADQYSTNMLLFWQHFEPRLNFILVTTSPERMLASAMCTGHGSTDIEQLLEQWTEQHERLLRFYHRNPKRCLLIDAAECAANTSGLLALCQKRWKLSLSETDQRLYIEATPAPDALAIYLAKQILQDYPEIESLRQELNATLTSLGEEASASADASTLFTGADVSSSLIAAYRALQDRSKEAARIETLESELSATKQQFEAESSSLKQELLAAQNKHQKETAQAQAKISEAAQENELLLQQLHQVQEELEALFLQHETSKKEVTVLTQNRDKQTSLVAEGKKQLAELKARPQASEQQTAQISSLQLQLKEQQEENELLLLQLHQVQEELEHYFLQHQQVQQQAKDLEARYQNLLQRNPGFSDYGKLELLQEDVSTQTCTWLLKDFSAAGGPHKELRFQSCIENSVAGLVFTRDGSGNKPFLRWPDAEQQRLEFIPTGAKDKLQQRQKLFLSIGPTDLHLLQTLAKLLIEALADKNQFKINAAEPLRKGLATFNKIIESLPSILRYDTLTLKREQVNPDYEHLWFQFNNLTLGEERWPNFEFRLSCAHVTPADFGSFPKLEFPEAGNKGVLDSWYNESQDDFGTKMELRYQVSKEMDATVWNKLSGHDKHFLTQLIDTLLDILRNSETKGGKLQRPWQDWQNLARNVQLLTKKLINPPSVGPTKKAIVKEQAPLVQFSGVGDAHVAETKNIRPKPKLKKQSKPATKTTKKHKHSKSSGKQ